MKKIFLSAFILFVVAANVNAQGCSDAGVCTIHSIKNNTVNRSENDNSVNEVVIGFNFGKGEKSVSYYTSEIEYTRSVSNHTSVTGKLEYRAIAGGLANTNGLGDLFLSVNHGFGNGKIWQ